MRLIFKTWSASSGNLPTMFAAWASLKTALQSTSRTRARMTVFEKKVSKNNKIIAFTRSGSRRKCYGRRCKPDNDLQRLRLIF